MKTPITFLLLMVSAASFGQKSAPEQELDDICYSKNVREVLTTNYNFYQPYRDSGKIALKNYTAKYPANPYRFVAMRYLAEIFEKCYQFDSAVLYYKQVMSSKR